MLMSVQVYGINHLAIEVDDVARQSPFMKTSSAREKMDERRRRVFKIKGAPISSHLQGQRTAA
jgi:hypothetical protein